MATRPRPERISEQYISSARARLSENKRVRRRLPIWGRLHIDRQLPFLCVYRRPPDRKDAGAERLVMGEATYMTAPGERQVRKDLSRLVLEIASMLGEAFGGFLILEVWSSPRRDADIGPESGGGIGRPRFRIFAPRTADLSSTIESLESALRRIRLRKLSPEVEIVSTTKTAPPGLPALVPPREASQRRISVMGLEISPVYRDAKTGEVYPLVLRALHRQLARVFKQTFFEFTRSNTTHRPPHYQALGRRAMVKAVWQVDRQLAEVSNSYDFLLAVTPVNARSAWLAFRRSGFERAPGFVYRPLPISPALLKRTLYAIPIERIEDPVVAQIFREKQAEIDRQLTALADRESRRFLYASLQLFGGVEDGLMATAEDLLRRIPPHSRERGGGRKVDAVELAKRAEAEIAFFRKAYPEISASVQLRDDISGLMVSRGHLLVSKETSVPASRVEALIQHEVGTHVLTYYNGRAQPFRQLYAGLAGYEELQEGLAVLAEYLVGGLSRPRMRLLAARVVAVRRLVEGASFVDAFRELHRDHGFSRQAAFSIAMRIYRAGGLTKDANYLKGLMRVLKYLANGGELDPIFIGKIGVDHLPVVQELLWRQVLRPPPLRPRYLSNGQSMERLERLRAGLSVHDLVRRRTKT